MADPLLLKQIQSTCMVFGGKGKAGGKKAEEIRR